MRFSGFVDAKGVFALTVWSGEARGWVPVSTLLTDRDERWETFDFRRLSTIAQTDSSTFERIRDALERAGTNARTLELNEKFRYLPNLAPPQKILCVGLNYAEHAAEFKDDLPTEPVFFNKAPTSINAHRGEIVLPPVSSRVDYEGELVVVIGKDGKNIPREKATEHVAAFTCGNDVSARDWQKDKPAGQWFLGKSFDTFAPIGPAFVTPDEVGDPNNLNIETRLNGRVMQSSNTSRFIFPIDFLIAYVSRVTTLRTGDLIFTGTPNGVGDVRKPPVYLRAGDEIVVEIENIGTLRNAVVQGDGAYKTF